MFKHSAFEIELWSHRYSNNDTHTLKRSPIQACCCHMRLRLNRKDANLWFRDHGWCHRNRLRIQADLFVSFNLIDAKTTEFSGRVRQRKILCRTEDGAVGARSGGNEGNITFVYNDKHMITKWSFTTLSLVRSLPFIRSDEIVCVTRFIRVYWYDSCAMSCF